MEPGTELDKLIAEKVMGWTWFTDEFNPRPVLVSPHRPIGQTRMPDYSTDIKAAWEVVEEMQKKDWAIVIDNMKDFLGNWQVQFEKDGYAIKAEAESVPLAICRSALIAKS